MRKITSIMVFVLLFCLLASCSLVIKDPSGWEIYQFGWALNDGEVLIQSHDGYKIGENIMYETVRKIPIVVENVLDRTIEVLVTYPTEKGFWVKIPSLSSVTLETLTQSDNVL